MKGFFSFVRKETLHILRDRRTMLIVLLMPVVQLLLFGFAISVEVNNIDFAVVASHPTEAVRRQVERIAANPYFTFGGYIRQDEADEVLRTGEVGAVVVFADDYDRRTAGSGEPDGAAIQLIFDASNPNDASSGAGYLRSVLLAEGTGGAPTPELHLFYNPQMKSSYNFVPGNEFDMGSHMLEVSPSIGTIAKPKLAIYPLGIGGKSDPVRLVFSGKPADAVVVSMADERERFRLLMDEVTIVEPQGSLKNLPCARAVWKPKPDLKTAVQCWITAGGSHHTCMTTSVGREAWEDFARIAGVELAVIDENTNARQFEKELELSEMYHRLNNRH